MNTTVDSRASRMPVLFIGHGSPTTAFEDNHYTRRWAALAQQMPRPRAIVCVSAHWYTCGTGVTAAAQPRMIYDFYGFPAALYEYVYPAPGEPELAQRLVELLSPAVIALDQEWGFDHGSWTLLKHMFPHADVPVIQLSIDGTRDAAFHFDVGQRLAPLRDEGVLILGSGNIVHNLRAFRQHPDTTVEWPPGAQFSRQVRDSLLKHDFEALVHYPRFGDSARQSVPTPDHYLPLLYALGASHADEPVSTYFDDETVSTIDMMSVKIGG